MKLKVTFLMLIIMLSFEDGFSQGWTTTSNPVIIKENGSYTPRGTLDWNEKLRMTGSTSDYIISVQDGSGRVAHYWNASAGWTSQYLVSGEPAGRVLFSPESSPYYQINWAPSGTAGGGITWQSHFSIKTNGYVGIGTNSPTTKLDIRGGDLTVFKNDLIVQDKNNGASDASGVGYDGDGILKVFSDYRVNFQESDANLTKIMMDLNEGAMSINTTVIPSGYKLVVDGKAIMEEVKVESSGSWPDYVFSEDYNLPSLSETEQFIKENKHLPGIPSAKEVEAEGIAIGEMNAKLLEKIEELTLHQIEMMKLIEDQGKRIRELESIKPQNAN